MARRRPADEMIDQDILGLGAHDTVECAQFSGRAGRS